MADSSTSSLSILNGGTNRMSGLMSGLDTESLVKASAAKTKIALNTKKQKLQTLTWKQEAYRNVTTKLTDFKNKFLDILSSDSIKSNASMNKYSAASTNDKLLVSAKPGAVQTDYEITYSQEAKAAELKGSDVLTGGINLDFSGTSSGTQTVQFTIDGTTRNVSFEGVSGDAAKSKENFLAALNKASANFSSARFEFNGNELVVDSSNDSVTHSFGIKASDAVGLSNDASNQISTSAKLGDISFKNALAADDGKFEFNINGESFSFTKDSTVEDVIKAVNSSEAGVTLSFSSLSQSFSIKNNLTGAGSSIEISQTKGNLLNSMFGKSETEIPTGSYISKSFGNDGGKNAVVSTASSLTFVDGDNNEYTVNASDTSKGVTVQDLLDFKTGTGENEKALFSYYDELGVLTLNGNGTLKAKTGDTAASAFLKDAFDGSVIRGKDSNIFVERGENARITVNGVTLESATSSFTVDGTTFDVSKLKDFDSSKEGVDPITVTTKHDTSAIKDTIKNFINEYNDLIKEMDELVKTKRPKKNGSYFDPLTEEQEEEMDDKEIEKWNEEAKKGLLYNDSTVIRAMSNIKNAMTSAFGGMSLSDLGITMNKYSSGSTANVYEIDDSKLDAAIAKWGDDVAKFFTDPNEGLAYKLDEAFDKAVSTKKNSAGYSIGMLTQLAGVKGSVSDTKNQMYNQMNSVQKMIDSLTKKYDKEQERYWNRFTQLEKYLSKMQSQSTVFGGGSY